MFDRILLVGDSHGNASYFRLALQVANHLGIRLVVSVGDFGFWPTGIRFVSGCREQAKELGITLLVIDGNHDAPGTGRRDDGGFLGWTAPTDGLRLDPALLATPELWHVERGTRVRLADREVVFVGSAVSIDRSRRTEGRSWWPTEAISESETARIADGGTADLLLSHDSAYDPPGTPSVRFDPELALDLATQRQRMQRITEALAPKLHVHGHWHRRYMTDTPTGPVIGLDYESTLGLHVIDLARLERTAARLDPLIAAMWWFDSYDADQQATVLDELAASNDPQVVLGRHEAAIHGAAIGDGGRGSGSCREVRPRRVPQHSSRPGLPGPVDHP